jgi:hypothetical protein
MQNRCHYYRKPISTFKFNVDLLNKQYSNFAFILMLFECMLFAHIILLNFVWWVILQI